jgi:signal transduction histidine kinase/ActR/RegA family two-component response regulator
MNDMRDPYGDVDGKGRPRLMLAMAFVGLMLLISAGIAMVLYNERSYAENKLSQVEAQAGILASTVTAALAFHDLSAAQEYANALRADPDVHAVGVYDVDGSLIAGYSLDSSSLPAQLPAGATSADNTLVVTVPVKQAAAVLGTVYVRSALQPLSLRLERYAVIALLVAMAAAMFVVVIVTQRALAATNRELTGKGADLARANEELRNEIAHRQRVEEALRQSQKMEAIGQLTGGIAHDFNNLLQVIVGNLEVLQLKLGKDADERRFVAAALRGAARGAALTQRLLAFARRQPLDPKPIDVNRLVVDMSELLHSTLGESIDIEAVLASGLWPVMADANQLESALLNLCVNARDAMPEGGRLTIETANATLDERYASEHDVGAGEYVMMAVSDGGTGMTQDVAEHAFEPFFTTKDVGKGSGLGLSQVYGFIKQSGGHVKIDSAPGQGTTVKVYLPRLVLVGPPVHAIAPVVAHTADSHDSTILVVEDDDDVRAYTASMLRDFGYRVTEVRTASEALSALAARNDIDLLFTDVGLPGGMNGRQLAQEAVRRRPKLRVLFTSGYARDALAHEGRLDPGVDLIAKPFTRVALASKVREALMPARAHE